MGTNREDANSAAAVSDLTSMAAAYRNAANQWRRLSPEAITPVVFAELSIQNVRALEQAANAAEQAAKLIERLSDARSDCPPGSCSAGGGT